MDAAAARFDADRETRPSPIVDQPAEPTTFKAVVGWARRGPNDRIQEDPARPLRFRR